MSIDCLFYEIKVLQKVSEQLLYCQRIELTAEEAVTLGACPAFASNCICKASTEKYRRGQDI